MKFDKLLLGISIAKKLSVLEYYSRVFNVLVEWDGRERYTLQVVASNGKVLRTVFAYGYEDASNKSDELRDYYILGH